jgi:hypothetical protein
VTASGAPLPPVYEGELDEATLRAYLADLDALAAAPVLLIRWQGEQRARPSPERPESPGRTHAVAALLRGEASLQFRYVHEDLVWMDTLVPVQGRVRIVRIAHRDLGAAGP